MYTIIKKYSRIGLLLVAVQFFLGSSCNKNGTKPCHNGATYSFKITTELLNEKELYYINDTIILISILPKVMTDYSTPYPKDVDYSNSVGIGGPLRTFAIDSINHQLIYAIDSVALVSVTGLINDDTGASSSTRSLYFSENPTDYQLKILIILRKKGNYQIAVNDFGSKGVRGSDCKNAGFANQILNANKHLQILINAEIPGTVLDQALTDHIYCFRVQ